MRPAPRLAQAASAAWLALAGPVAAAGAVDATSEAILERVDFARETGQLALAGETVLSRVALNQLYARFDFKPLWQQPGRVEQLLAAVRDSATDGLTPGDYHLQALETLWREVRIKPTAENVADLDVLATDAYILLLYHLYFGKVDPVSLTPTWNFQARDVTGERAVDYLVRAITSGRIREAAAELRPDHWMYEHARRALGAYRRIEAEGGWPEIADGPTLKPGTSDSRVVALRRRLAVTGDLMDQPLDSEVFDAPLEAAVRSFQERHLLTADGAVGRSTLRELNVPVAERIRQIRVNLERARHILHELGDGPTIAVDIAGYEVRWLEGRRVTWTSRVIVGQPARETPTFKAQVEYIVLNPTWTVPPGILAKDVLPGVRRDPRYLAKKGLEVFDRNGRPVDPATVEWSRYTVNNFPYLLRQAAGEDNALGRAKIMFPNPHLVYLHDTPTRSLFDREDRTFSSGCIRVEKVLELVARLLDGTQWTREALDAAVATGETRTVRLPRPVPVLLLYWTLDEDARGRIVFKRDPYGRDAPLATALDRPFAFGARPAT